MPQRPPVAGGPPRHVRALDGLRAFAVLAVIASHVELPRLGGGALGVDVFFVLSGFLISSLVAAEEDATGRVWWRGFYARRALRLLPALWVAAAGTLLLMWLTRGSIGPDDLARNGLDPSLDVVANTWREVGAALLYVADLPLRGTEDVVFNHAWSLAVEEQFYFLLPFGWMGLRRLGRLVPSAAPWAILVAAAVGLGVLRVAGVAGPLDLVQLRAEGLLLGCAAAFARRDPRVAPALGRAATALALPSAVALVALVLSEPRTTSVTGRLVFSAAAIASVVLVTALWEGRAGVLGSALAVGPAVAIGRMSYGLYLYHLPICRRIALVGLDWPGPAVVALKVALSFVVAAASFRWIERPLLRRKDRYRPTEGVAAPPSAAASA